MPPSALSAAVWPKRWRRKCGRAAEEVEGLDEGNVMFSALADDPDPLARALRTRLWKTRTTKRGWMRVMASMKKT